MQKQGEPEEEEIQVKIKESIQRQPEEEEEPIQAKCDDGALIQKQEEEPEEEEEIQTKPVTGQITPIVQAQPEEEEEVQMQLEEEEEEEQLQTKTKSKMAPDLSSHTESQIKSLRGGGRPLSKSERNFFEPRFGYDFSPVRVHASSQAAETARKLNAKAYALGKDIVLGSGKYASEALEGWRFLAHELVHTIQQVGSSLARIQRIPKNPENTPFDGEIGPKGAWLHKSPDRRADSRLAGLLPGKRVTVLNGRAWILVETVINGKTIQGYVSHELIKAGGESTSKEATAPLTEETPEAKPPEAKTDSGTNTPPETETATEDKQKKEPTALEKLDAELNEYWPEDSDILSLLGELDPAEKQTVLKGYRDRLVSELSNATMAQALDILEPDCDTRREWLKAEGVRLNYFTTGSNYTEGVDDCSLDQDLKTRVMNLCECLVALRLVKSKEFAATSACRTKKKAHRLSTAYHIASGYVSLADLQAHLPSPGKAGDEVRDEDNLWYVRGWTLGQAKAQALENWGSGNIVLAYEGYEVGDVHRDPNTKNPKMPIVSAHVYGKAIDVLRGETEDWAVNPWDAAVDPVIKSCGLARPVNKSSPYGPAAAEWWHFEKP